MAFSYLAGWTEEKAADEAFSAHKKILCVLFLELGVGYNTKIRRQSICINEDIGKVLGDLG